MCRQNISTWSPKTPTKPVVLSRVPYPSPGYSHQGWLTDDHRHYLHGDEFDEMSLPRTRTMIFDLTDLDNAKFVDAFNHPTADATDHNMYVRGDFVYQANYAAGLRVLDIRQIATTAIGEVGYFDLTPDKAGSQMIGAWSVYPFFSDGTTLISEHGSGLFVVLPQPWYDLLP